MKHAFKALTVACLFGLLGTPAQALDYCEDLWFTRNLEFHKAGQCFGSALGRAVFGNEGCTGQASLSPAAAERVARAKAEERLEGCKVDTSRASLAIPLIEVRKALVDSPFPSPFESSCIGWTGPRQPLRAARAQGGEVIATISQGDTLLFQFEDVDGWSFVEIVENGLSVGMGWGKFEIGQATCEAIAG